MKSGKPYNYAIDILRVSGIFAVVLIHTTSKTLELSHFDVIRLPFSLFLNQSARFAVPLLFFISGFVLQLNYPKVTSITTFYKKRGKLLVPFFFWSFIYFFFVYPQPDVPIFSGTFFYQILTGEASYQLYFIPSLYILYFFFPFIHRLLIQMINKRWLLILGLAQIMLLAIDYYYFEFKWYTPIKTALLNLYIFSLGIIACHYEKEVLAYIKKRFWMLVGLMVLVLASMYYEVRTLYIHDETIHYIYSQWRPMVFLYTLLFTSIFYYLFQKVNRFGTIILFLSRVSFFVFFVHVIFIHVYWRFIGSYLFSKSAGHVVDSFWFEPSVFFFVLGMSILTGYIVQFIPKFNTLMGLK